jgi:hypothetical protein
MDQSQARQIVCETLSQKTLSQKWASEVAQGAGPEFKPQNCKKKKRERERDISGLICHFIEPDI